jgi:hypothetical protein
MRKKAMPEGECFSFATFGRGGLHHRSFVLSSLPCPRPRADPPLTGPPFSSLPSSASSDMSIPIPHMRSPVPEL